MENELIRQGEVITRLNSEVLVQPIGCEGSDHSNVKPFGKGRQRMLFIGGPLDGEYRWVPSDGRLYDHNCACGHNPLDDITTHRYIPSIISFKGQRVMVYLSAERIMAQIGRTAIEEEYVREATKTVIAAEERVGRLLDPPEVGDPSETGGFLEFLDLD